MPRRRKPVAMPRLNGRSCVGSAHPPWQARYQPLRLWLLELELELLLMELEALAQLQLRLELELLLALELLLEPLLELVQ